MKRAVNGFLSVLFIVYLAACQRHGAVEAATEGITVGETRANVELLLKSRGIEFKFRPPLDDTSTFPAELIEEEGLDSPTLVFFISEPPVDAIAKTTRIIVVLDQDGRVDRVMTNESYLGL